MKTDLSKILSVSGQHGLFNYIAQARNGAIVEALSDGRRTIFDLKSRITSLADISIYTEEEEVKLQKVFEQMHAVLGDADAPDAKAPADALKALFAKALPNYDETRFYVCHMKKVVEWYNELKKHASLDFVQEDEAAEEEPAQE